MSQTDRKNYMSYWNFTSEEKSQLIARLTKELPALRGGQQKPLRMRLQMRLTFHDRPSMQSKCKKGK